MSQTQEMENMKKYFIAAFFKYIGKPEMTGNQKREMSSKYMSWGISALQDVLILSFHPDWNSSREARAQKSKELDLTPPT